MSHLSTLDTLLPHNCSCNEQDVSQAHEGVSIMLKEEGGLHYMCMPLSHHSYTEKMVTSGEIYWLIGNAVCQL